MKRILSFLIFILLAMGASAAGAQTVVMDEGHVAFDYPDSWLVVSPQLCGVYAPLLADAGLDADDVAKELTDTRTLSRAYNADYTQYLAVLIREDELSQEIYEIDAMTDAQKTTLRRRAESNSLWETTGLRAQDVEWQKENGENWLYIHYIVTRSGTTVGRGLRYVTVHNGLYVELDWRIESGRFSGRDLNAFRARLADITITESVAEPVRDVKLDAEIPTETSVGQVTISGTATAGRDGHRGNAGRQRRDADPRRGDGFLKRPVHAGAGTGKRGQLRDHVDGFQRRHERRVAFRRDCVQRQNAARLRHCRKPDRDERQGDDNRHDAGGRSASAGHAIRREQKEIGQRWHIFL